MNKCAHHVTTKPQGNTEIPKSLLTDDSYVMVGKDCSHNKSRQYSKYCFLRTHVCEKCQADAAEKAVTK